MLGLEHPSSRSTLPGLAERRATASDPRAPRRCSRRVPSGWALRRPASRIMAPEIATRGERKERRDEKLTGGEIRQRGGRAELPLPEGGRRARCRLLTRLCAKV